jgi:hypothetical protein
MAAAAKSKLETDLVVDDPLVQNAAYRFDAVDRQWIDNQIRAIQQHLVRGLLVGVHATWMRLAGTSAAVVAGDCVCNASAADGTVTAAVATILGSPMTDAGIVAGVVLMAATPGALVLVATSGKIGPEITDLGPVTGFARLDETTGRIVRAASISSGQYCLGYIDGTGWLTLSRTVRGVGAAGGGGGGGSAPAGGAGAIVMTDGAGGFIDPAERLIATTTAARTTITDPTDKTIEIRGGNGLGTPAVVVMAGNEGSQVRLEADSAEVVLDTEIATINATAVFLGGPTNNRVYVDDAGVALSGNVVVPDASFTPAKLDNGSSCSVLGRAVNSSGARADIAAATNGYVLQRSADALSFAACPYVASATNPASLGLVRVAHGGGTYVDVIWMRNAGNTGDYPLIRQFSNSPYIHGAGSILLAAGTGGGAGYGVTQALVEPSGFTFGGGLDSAGGSFGSGVGVASVKNADTNPTVNPTSGGILYADAGAGKWRGSSGTVTTFGPADPHCPKCGRDFALEWSNETFGEELAVCVPCLITSMRAMGADTRFVIKESLSS